MNRKLLPAYALFTCLFLSTTSLCGQLFSPAEGNGDLLGLDPFVGINIGYSNFSISGFERTLGASISDPSTYDFDEGNLAAIELGVTFLQPINPEYLFLQLDVDYITPLQPNDPFKKAHALYQDVDDLEYAFSAAYQRVHIRPMLGCFLFSMLSVKAGLDWGINTTPSTLNYNSNDLTIGRDLAIKSELTDKLVGKNHVGFVVSPEVTIITQNFMVSVGAMWTYGFSDLVMTQANNYRLQEAPNRLSSLSIRLSGKYVITW